MPPNLSIFQTLIQSIKKTGSNYDETIHDCANINDVNNKDNDLNITKLGKEQNEMSNQRVKDRQQLLVNSQENQQKI